MAVSFLRVKKNNSCNLQQLKAVGFLQAFEESADWPLLSDVFCSYCIIGAACFGLFALALTLCAFTAFALTFQLCTC